MEDKFYLPPLDEKVLDDLEGIQHSALLAAHMGILLTMVPDNVVDSLEDDIESGKANGYGKDITNLRPTKPSVLKYDIWIWVMSGLCILSVILTAINPYLYIVDGTTTSVMYNVFRVMLVGSVIGTIISYVCKRKYLKAYEDALTPPVWRDTQLAYIGYLTKYCLDDNTVDLSSDSKLSIDILYSKDKMGKFIDILSKYPQYDTVIPIFKQHINALDKLGYIE